MTQPKSTHLERTQAAVVDRQAPALKHIYPRPRSGDGVGWIAYCGYVKKTRWSGQFAYEQAGRDQCVVCAQMNDTSHA